MNNLSILNNFFNERINSVDGKTRPLLQRLKSVCERRASGQISEEKALMDLDKILGRKSQPVIPSFAFGNGTKQPVLANLLGEQKNFKQVNVLAGVKTNYKPAPMFDVKDFNLQNKREQFPILGLKPLHDGKKNKFIVSPLSRTWFDVKDFRKQESVINNFKNVKQNNSSVLGGLNFVKQNKSVTDNFKSDFFSHRLNESNKAMKAMIGQAKQGMGFQPALMGMVSPMNPRHGKRVYPKRQQSVFEMMGGRK